MYNGDVVIPYQRFYIFTVWVAIFIKNVDISANVCIGTGWFMPNRAGNHSPPFSLYGIKIRRQRYIILYNFFDPVG